MNARTVADAAQEQSKDLRLINWLRAQQDDLAAAAASHLKPATIIRVAQGALRKNDKLMAAAIANPQSLLYCMLDAVRLGHEPGTDQYWLIPFGNEVTGIEGYKGVIERMYRAGGVSTVHAEVVRQRDAYRSMGSRVPPVHEYDEFADPDDRGPLRGVYAYAIMADGSCSQVMRMGRAEVMKHKAMSRGSNRDDSPWQKWEEPMWKKAPLNALEPYVPTSSEWLTARAQAVAEARARVAVPGWTPPAITPPAVLQLPAGSVIEDPSPAPDGNAGAVPPSAESAGEAPILTATVEKIWARLAALGVEERNYVRVASQIAGKAMKHGTEADGRKVLDTLEGLDAAGLDGLLADLMMAADPRGDAGE